MCKGKGCNYFTDYFECEVLSPVLFSLLLEDVELLLHDDPLCGQIIDELLLVILHYLLTF